MEITTNNDTKIIFDKLSDAHGKFYNRIEHLA
jgi:hypothetical protein